jgi:pimeloyl-ACP methyl ester carboxylesterase
MKEFAWTHTTHVLFLLVALCFLTGCTQFAPYRKNSSATPNASVISGPNNRYQIAFVEFGEDGLSQDTTQLEIARRMINNPGISRPLVVVYVHGWQNNADSTDVCRFQRFIDALSTNNLVNEHHLTVMGVYLAWRGKSLNVKGVNTLTFWNREQNAHRVANAVPPDANTRALYTLSEAVTTLSRDLRQKKHSYKGRFTPPRAILLGHSFGALVLEESITKDILKAANEGSEDAITWDLAVTLNSANDSQNSRQILQNFADLYRHEGDRYVSKKDPRITFPDRRTALISVTSESDVATKHAFPAGSWLGGLFKARMLRDDDISRAQTFSLNSMGQGWKGGWFAKLPIPGEPERTAWRGEFATTTPGHNDDLVNLRVEDLQTPPAGEIPSVYRTAFNLNVGRNRDDRVFYTSEPNAGRELKLCQDSSYTPQPDPTGTGAEWHKWKIVRNAHPMSPYWIFRVPKQIIDGHGGIWSDNSIALLGALYRMQVPLVAEARAARPGAVRPTAPAAVPIPRSPELQNRQFYLLPPTSGRP